MGNQTVTNPPKNKAHISELSQDAFLSVFSSLIKTETYFMTQSSLFSRKINLCHCDISQLAKLIYFAI